MRSYLATLFLCLVLLPKLSAATVDVIQQDGPSNLDGKEVDWIIGDYVMSNDILSVVIANPVPNRDANMTVRGVGAAVIDLTRNDIPSDQLSAFYPAAGRFKFTDSQFVTSGTLQANDNQPPGVFWRCRSSEALAKEKANAEVEYQLRDGDPFLTCIVNIQGDDISSYTPADGVRADRTFRFDTIPGTSIAYCEDLHFRQTYGFEVLNSNAEPVWSKDRLKQIRYKLNANEGSKEDNKTVSWSTRIYPSSSPIDLLGLTRSAKPQVFNVSGVVGDQPRTKLTIIEGNTKPLKGEQSWYVADNGNSIVHLPAGEFTIRAEAIGHTAKEVKINVSEQPGEFGIDLSEASWIEGKVTDEEGKPIPCKITFYAKQKSDQSKTNDPNFGLDSQSGSVGNCVYCADGEFVRSIPIGHYDVVISHGPEYDAVFDEVHVNRLGGHAIEATLRRVVDTKGWVSAELHSHSSPSGDNTSSQLGRVENLVCEHIEFAPCTEHQRIDSYDDALVKLGATDLMATCTGMELTGSLLPINHQNAFPLKWYPRTQNGGGPQTDNDPIAQIARIAMWDDNSDKVVQTNHPNMKQLLRDRDLDGEEDGGFSKMLDFMDIIEVHPAELIFQTGKDPKENDRGGSNRIRPWMELIASGRRIPGVVNTDAHYNLNGSGWRRNWIRCSTDDPSKISVDEMTRRLEGGQIVMSTGPFMHVQLHSDTLNQPAEVGDDVKLSDGQGEIAVKIQCANWLDVNRVEVFVGGKPVESLSRKRSSHPDAFGDGVVKFDQRLPITIDQDTFIIVAAIGEKLEMTRVMGQEYGKRPPVVVSNPIFVRMQN